MRFALLQEGHRLAGSIEDRFSQLLDEAQLADEVGWDVYGCSEQHFITYDFANVSAPEVILGAVAARTKRIKLRPMGMIVSFNHPIRMAERIALLNAVSGGRAEMGLGRSNGIEAIPAFEVNMADTPGHWREAVEIVQRAFTTNPFSYEGKNWNIPPRTLTPVTETQAQIPIHTTGKGRETHVAAAELGIGVMSVDSLLGWDYLAGNWEAYRENLTSVNVAGNDQLTRSTAFLSMNAYCASTQAEAEDIARPMVDAFFNFAVPVYREIGRRYEAAGTSDRDYSYLIHTGEGVDASDMRKLHERSPHFMIGTPDFLIERIKRLESLGCDEVILRMDGYTHEQILESIRLIGEHVIPAFR
jgi:alkanesulfonate monooxygenase SsuD/methylene tetrahydromethanopterin reductase-like flavin-dependent oxidoreductase (luciferase family)